MYFKHSECMMSSIVFKDKKKVRKPDSLKRAFKKYIHKLEH